MLKPEVVKILSVVGLTLATLGTTGVVADTVMHLVQSNLIGKVWLTLGALSLLALANLTLIIGAYKLQRIELHHFAALMVGMLALTSAAFSILGRLLSH